MSGSDLVLVGKPLSTFTRTMRMAFAYLDVAYGFEETFPHSELAYKYNPFGRIPSIIHKGRVVYETAAIRRYIDATFSSRLTPSNLDAALKVDQLISILSDYVFHHIIFGFAKPRIDLESKGISEEEIQKRLEKPLKTSLSILKTLDSVISDTEFLCGSEITWADYFVYPPLADIYSLPEVHVFAESAPKLYAWFEKFQNRPEVKETYPDTVADMRQKQSSL
ncbi:glutathione S-transferase [Backusella circina FSU 941]|nr:glutathione S-transferase [Backusella circina FSU 941]